MPRGALVSAAATFVPGGNRKRHVYWLDSFLLLSGQHTKLLSAVSKITAKRWILQKGGNNSRIGFLFLLLTFCQGEKLEINLYSTWIISSSALSTTLVIIVIIALWNSSDLLVGIGDTRWKERIITRVTVFHNSAEEREEMLPTNDYNSFRSTFSPVPSAIPRLSSTVNSFKLTLYLLNEQQIHPPWSNNHLVTWVTIILHFLRRTFKRFLSAEKCR